MGIFPIGRGNALMPPDRPLWTREFILFNIVIFLSFINIAVFFPFEDYLRTLSIDPRWFGLIIGLFSAVSLLIRPFISHLCHQDNARLWISLGTIGVIAALSAYGWAETFWSMSLLRVFHGAAHLILATALMTVIVHRIPPGKSGQAFGILSIITLLPYAVVPPVLKKMTDWLGGYPMVLIFFAFTMILIFPLIFLRSKEKGPDKARAVKLTGAEIFNNLKDRKILFILTAMLLFYSGYAVVFFFLAGYARELGIENGGLFFTLSTAGEIGIRLFASRIFDRTDKKILAGVTLILLSGGYVLLAKVNGTVFFFVLGFFLGLGWGIVMPVLNALLFDISQPDMRAFNTNLGLQMFQGGFFFGPLAGTPILHQVGYEGLYLFCAALTLITGALIFITTGHRGESAGVKSD
jgi:predicted MFS family arabinose efflux permease